MTRKAEGITMRQAKRIVASYAKGEGQGRKPRNYHDELPLTGLGMPPATEFEEYLAEAYENNMLCLACLKPTDCFYLIAGSGEFYMQQLVRLGVPPQGALLTAARKKGDIVRSTPCCLSCATLAGMEKMPMSYTEISMRAAEGLGREQPVPVAILGESDEIIQAFLDKMRENDRKRDEARKKQEEYEMRLKGAQKDVADFIEKLERGEVEGLEGKGYLADPSNGHIKIYYGEPDRAVPSDGRFIHTMSSTPRNAHRTILNAKGYIHRWELDNLKTEEPAVPEDDEMPRQYTQRTDAEKAALVARYDYADEAGQRALLEKHHIRHRDIARYREWLIEHGWKVSAGPVPLPDEPERTQACKTCGKDLALTRDNFAQEKFQGKYRWPKECIPCGDKAAVTEVKRVTVDAEGVIEDGNARVTAAKAAGIETIPVERSAETPPLDNSEATRMITLMKRKRDINMRVAVIDEEKAGKEKELEEKVARLRELLSKATAELDQEKSLLIAERGKVETELLELVSG